MCVINVGNILPFDKQMRTAYNKYSTTYGKCIMTSVTKSTSPSKDLPVNLKEKNANHIFRVTIRDQSHFYRLIKWLNENVGKGADKWTMEGRVLKSLRQGKPVSPKVYIFKEDFDESNASYLSLL